MSTLARPTEARELEKVGRKGWDPEGGEGEGGRPKGGRPETAYRPEFHKMTPGSPNAHVVWTSDWNRAREDLQEREERMKIVVEEDNKERNFGRSGEVVVGTEEGSGEA